MRVKTKIFAPAQAMQEIAASDLLSFGTDRLRISLGALNVFIGPNGSGKSNLIDLICLMRATPDSIQEVLQNGGGIMEWLHKDGVGDVTPSGKVSIALAYADTILSHAIGVGASTQSYRLTSEVVLDVGRPEPSFRYLIDGQTFEMVRKTDSGRRQTRRTNFPLDTPMLKVLRDPITYPELDFLLQRYESMRVYRSWRLGPESALRVPQNADQPNDLLSEDLSNLGLILNKFKIQRPIKDKIDQKLNEFIPSATSYEVVAEGGTVQIFLIEGGMATPAKRMSDGTLKYLCLLAILLHPNPPSLVCIEEPEIGLHPDILPGLADLLVEASERMQLIVTTHSDILVDALSHTPESIVVCEKGEEGTQMKRLNAEELKPWLEKYKLGQLWLKGGIGGTRW